MAKEFNSLKTCLNLSDRLGFGKFQGAELRSVIICAPDYINWLLENTTTFFISKEVYEFLDQRKNSGLDKFAKKTLNESSNTGKALAYQPKNVFLENTFQKHHVYSQEDPWDDDIPF